MAIRITDLSELNALEVRQEDELIAEQLQEDNPTLDMKRGVLRDYLAYYGAVLATKNQVEQERQRRSTTINEILVDPTLADDDTVDNVASNYRVTRDTGGFATGAVTIVLNSATEVTIPAGTRFTALEHTFAVDSTVTSRASSDDVVSASDQVLTTLDDGNYSFQVQVTAEAVGTESQLAKDTVMLPDVEPLNYEKSFATEDFISGLDADSNQTLLDRFISGMSAKALSNRDNMWAALTDQTAFKDIVADSIIGMGDSEMLRDQHSIFPGSLGGRVDWYIRTQARYRTYGITKEAVLAEKTSDDRGIWQLTFLRDDYPGLYDINSIRPTGEDDDFVGSFEITDDIRGTDLSALSNDGFLPDIDTAVEGAYSRFQTVVIKFEDTLTDTATMTASSTKQDYAVSLRVMPLIEELQDYVSSRRVRNVAGDILVKGPIPCFVRLSFTLELNPGETAPDTDDVAEELATLVNNYGFTGRLPASAVCDVIHNHIETKSYSLAVDMFGQIRRPDGVIRQLRSTEILKVPDEPEHMVTARTVGFFLEPANVTITVVTADIPEV